MPAKGVTTGISAHDRARTIQVLVDPKATPRDLVQPGHVFPLRAKAGGVLRRAGHTEASVDLARLAGLSPAGVLCEILQRRRHHGAAAGAAEISQKAQAEDVPHRATSSPIAAAAKG